MNIEDKELLQELAEYKLQYGYCCSRCGSSEFSNGKEEYSRRCRNSKCRYEESLFKNTVFENCKFSLDVAVSIISEIKETSSANVTDEIIFHDKMGYVSLEKFTELHKKSDQKPSFHSTNEKIHKAINLKKKSIRQLSQQYNVEENTITKFVERISTRIHGEDVGKRKNSHIRVIDYFNEYHYNDIEYFLSKFMFPLPGQWVYGCRVIGNNIIIVRDDFQRENELQKFHYVRFNLQEYRSFIIDKAPSIEGDNFKYGSNAWKHFFCEKYMSSEPVKYNGGVIRYQN